MLLKLCYEKPVKHYNHSEWIAPKPKHIIFQDIDKKQEWYENIT